MKFPNWVCITCGKPSSRRWNIKRHIEICHGSIGRYVSFMEYMAGRQNGLYQPSQYPNSFYGSSKNKVSLPEKMTEEFSLEWARQLARLPFNPTAIQTNQNIANNNNLWSIQQQHHYFHPAMWTWQNHLYVNGNNKNNNNNWSSIERIVDPSYLVFGYKAMMCNYCSEPKLERVLYKEDTNKATDSEISHNCKSSKPLNNTLRPEENNTDPLEAQKKQALALKQHIVNDWLIKGPICLMAAELSNPANEDFAVEISPKKIARINCSQVKEVDVFPTYKNQDHYIIRAIKDNPTYLTDDEIDEFLKIVGDSTFAVVKIHNANNSSVKFYFMALSPFLLRFQRRSNYDHDDSNNNNDAGGRNDDNIKTNLNVTATTITSSSNFKNDKIANADQILPILERNAVEKIADMLHNNNNKKIE